MNIPQCFKRRCKRKTLHVAYLLDSSSCRAPPLKAPSHCSQERRSKRNGERCLAPELSSSSNLLWSTVGESKRWQQSDRKKEPRKERSKARERTDGRGQSLRTDGGGRRSSTVTEGDLRNSGAPEKETVAILLTAGFKDERGRQSVFVRHNLQRGKHPRTAVRILGQHMMVRKKRRWRGVVMQHVCSVGRRCPRSGLHNCLVTPVCKWCRLGRFCWLDLAGSYCDQLYCWCCFGRVHPQGFSAVSTDQLEVKRWMVGKKR